MLKAQLDELRAALADRYTIERELGSGGMGTVYEVHDVERGERIALKTLHWAYPAAIYRFKREFRTLADVAHRNLVQLYELVARDDVWFFTMELVPGRDFLQHVRPGHPSRRSGAAITDVDGIAGGLTAPGDGAAPGVGGVLDEPRLRAALRQLIQGVAALHQAGILHRDIKPPNVLVTSTGRVVILDFGIAEEVVAVGSQRTVEQGISGTIDYMAPEQCAGDPCTPASDWYAVGALLYEALTGRLPFTGSMLEVLAAKQVNEPPRPESIVTGVPADLAEVCMALIAREPDRRPTDRELLARLRVSRPGVVVDWHGQQAEGTPVVGRTRHLAELHDAFRATAGGQVVSVCVYGPSGIGKTTLVRQFTDDLAATERAIVLAGRCFVRETVPYKALDGVIDMLSRLLRAIPERMVEERLPPDTAALARVFPVLRRVDAIDRRAATELDISDQRELRRRAFGAFVRILTAIARERPVVLHIDDLQWADRDSADVLQDLLRSNELSRVLFVLSFRSEDVAGAPFLGELLAGAATTTRRACELGPLATAEAIEYAMQLLAAHRPDAEAQALALAQESAGNPFLLDQMVRVALEADGGGDAPLGLEEMLAARLRQMPAGAPDLVAVLAIAGQPIDANIAYRAAGLEGDERPLVDSLRLAHLLRASATSGRIDLYHDRIRETLLQRIAPATAAGIHRRLAEGLEAKRVADPESLYEHYLGAGEAERAATFAAKAAAEALAALAFERAALFYRRALDLWTASGGVRGRWLAGLGDALAGAARGGEAALAYLDAMLLVAPEAALELERRAGQQYLISGRIQEGLAVMARVLAKVGLPQLPPTPNRAFLALAGRRVRIGLRGLRYTERRESAIAPDRLTRIDTCWAVAEGMALVDNIQGAAFQTLHLLLALDAGEPHRIGRALAMEAGFAASSGATQRSEQLLRQAEQLAERLGSRTILGLCRMIGAVAAVHGGRFEEAERFAVQAESILTEQQSLSAWPLSIARVYHISALIDEGKLVELSRVSREFLADATDRGNLFAATMFRTGWSTLRWLAAGDLAGARSALAEAQRQCPEGVFYIPHYNCLLAEGLIDLYAGDGEPAYRHITDTWPVLERSLVLRIRSVRVRCLRMRAACAIGAAQTARDPKPLLALADRYAGRMERERHYSVVLNNARAKTLRAGIAATRGDRGRAVGYLRRALAGFDECHSALWRAMAQRRLGGLLGGDEGRALLERSDAWMASEGVVDPARLTAAFVPGFDPA